MAMKISISKICEKVWKCWSVVYNWNPSHWTESKQNEASFEIRLNTGTRNIFLVVVVVVKVAPGSKDFTWTKSNFGRIRNNFQLWSKKKTSVNKEILKCFCKVLWNDEDFLCSECLWYCKFNQIIKLFTIYFANGCIFMANSCIWLFFSSPLPGPIGSFGSSNLCLLFQGLEWSGH